MIDYPILEAFKLYLKNGKLMQLIKHLPAGRGGNTYYDKRYVDRLLQNLQGWAISTLEGYINDGLEDLDILEIASIAEVDAGVVDNKAVSPQGLQSKIATPSKIGMVKIATKDMVVKGLSSDTVITPNNIYEKRASTVAIGLARLGTVNEVKAGTSTNVAVTPFDGYNLVSEVLNSVNIPTP